jgi:hypothetical protein
MYVASGFIGTLLTSADGINWTSRVSGTTNALHTLTYGAGTFVVAGTAGDLRTSPDGVTWTSRISGTTNSLRGAIYTNSNFVLTGFKGTIISSTNGMDWTAHSSGVVDALRSIAYGADAFVTVGHVGRILRTASLVVPTIVNVSFSSNTFNFSFASVNGLNYTIEYKNNLSDSSWTLLNTINGTDGVIPINDLAATVPSRFYRIGLQ